VKELRSDSQTAESMSDGCPAIQVEPAPSSSSGPPEHRSTGGSTRGHHRRIPTTLLAVMVCAVFTASCVSRDHVATPSSDQVSGQPETPTDGTSAESPSNRVQSESVDGPKFPSAEAVQEALQTWLGEGSVSVIDAYGDAVSAEQTYQLPPGSLGVAVQPGETGPTIQVMGFAYSANITRHQGIYDVGREYGGDTPEEVYSSSVIMIRDVGAAAGWGEGLGEYPDVAGGLVTDEWNSLVLAGDTGYWYEAYIVGVTGSAAYGDTLLTLGQLLADTK